MIVGKKKFDGSFAKTEPEFREETEKFIRSLFHHLRAKSRDVLSHAIFAKFACEAKILRSFAFASQHPFWIRIIIAKCELSRNVNSSFNFFVS